MRLASCRDFMERTAGEASAEHRIDGGDAEGQGAGAALEPGVRGLVFLGFPLHPSGRPSNERASHLFDVKIPMLFLQGARDALAELEVLRPIIRRLGTRATLKVFDDADHSFHVPARTGRKDSEVRSLVLDAFSAWIDGIMPRSA